MRKAVVWDCGAIEAPSAPAPTAKTMTTPTATHEVERPGMCIPTTLVPASILHPKSAPGRAESSDYSQVVGEVRGMGQLLGGVS